MYVFLPAEIGGKLWIEIWVLLFYFFVTYQKPLLTLFDRRFGDRNARHGRRQG